MIDKIILFGRVKSIQPTVDRLGRELLYEDKPMIEMRILFGVWVF